MYRSKAHLIGMRHRLDLLSSHRSTALARLESSPGWEHAGRHATSSRVDETVETPSVDRVRTASIEERLSEYERAEHAG